MALAIDACNPQKNSYVAAVEIPVYMIRVLFLQVPTTFFDKVIYCKGQINYIYFKS